MKNERKITFPSSFKNEINCQTAPTVQQTPNKVCLRSGGNRYRIHFVLCTQSKKMLNHVSDNKRLLTLVNSEYTWVVAN